MNIVGVAALAICAALVTLYLRPTRPEMAQLVSLGAGLVIFSMLLPYLSLAVESFNDLSQKSGIDNRLIAPVIKIIGIAYVAQFGSQMCADAGESALAGWVEAAGKIMIALIALPIAREVLAMIISILE